MKSTERGECEEHNSLLYILRTFFSISLLRIEALEMSNAKYVKTISDLETKLSKSTHSEADLRSKIDWTNREAKQAILELQQYRLRAQTTLQHKDKLIEQLKSAAATDPNVDVFSDPNAPAAPDAHSLELENLQRERSDLQIENRTLCEQMTALRAHIANNDAIVKRTRDDCEAAVQQMGEQLRNSAQKRRDCETDNRTQARELVVVREEMQRVQADFASKMHAKCVVCRNISKLYPRNNPPSSPAQRHRTGAITRPAAGRRQPQAAIRSSAVGRFVDRLRRSHSIVDPVAGPEAVLPRNGDGRSQCVALPAGAHRTGVPRGNGAAAAAWRRSALGGRPRHQRERRQR